MRLQAVSSESQDPNPAPIQPCVNDSNKRKYSLMLWLGHVPLPLSDSLIEAEHSLCASVHSKTSAIFTSCCQTLVMLPAHVCFTVLNVVTLQQLLTVLFPQILLQL